MYVTYIIYGLFVAILFWGARFAGFKDSQMLGDSIPLDVMKSLRGYAAIGIILHHISQENAFQFASLYGEQNELPFFLNYGFKLVSIIFFCSGYGLVKSIQTKHNYLYGFKKRSIIKKLAIPYYVSIIIYGIFWLIQGVHFAPMQWVFNILGCSMMNGHAWFPVVLAILYLTFYFVYENIDDKKSRYLFILMIIFFQGLYFSINGHFSWWAAFKGWWLLPSAFDNVAWWMQQKIWLFNGEWWVNSEIAFLVGIFVAENEEEVRDWFSHSYWIKLIGMVAAYAFTNLIANLAMNNISYWSEFRGTNPGIINKLVCFIAQMPQISAYVLMIYIILMKYKAENPVTRFFGKISFEVYMMNLLVLRAFSFLVWDAENNLPIYKAGHWNLGLYVVCVFAGTIVLGIIYKWLNRQACKLIK